jgi:signal transduction histidine kinase/DNA-binding response OmpR family regulator
MNFPHFSSLYDNKKLLIASKESILDVWVSHEQCARILNHHAVDIQRFRRYYASRVFDYFIGVVAKEVELGKCPIMKEFIEYLNDKEIRADELFILCSYFKRSVVAMTYTLGINSSVIFEAISYLFDMNFASVLTLYTDTIYQKEQEAIEANKAKEYFLSNMSHEIRTPLNAILGFVNVLQGENLGEKVEKYLTIISQSGENLLHIINDILDFSKLRSGEFAIDPNPFNLYEKMSNTLELFIPSAALRAITIEYRIHPNIPACICADSFRIQQIMGNLLSNAIKFSPDGASIEVMIDHDWEHSTLIIAIRDYGEGISPEEQGRIFTPFYQAHTGTRTHTIGGSGLGLSICKQLAIQMGGEIALKSNLGEGTLFTVTLAVEFLEETLCHTQTVSPTQTLSFVGKVLVAEDNEANQELIRITLQRYGITVEMVNNGQEAYEQACAIRYDLIFMDEQMPLLSGHEALKLIRSHEQAYQYLPTPIIQLSANALKGSRERALQWGYDAFIGKPFNLHAIEAVLKHYLLAQSPNPRFSRVDLPPMDEMERLEKVMQLSPWQIQQLLTLFHNTMEKLLINLTEAMESVDYPSVSRIAHTIKGSSANFRFEECSHCATQLEADAIAKVDEKKLQERYDYLLKAYAKIYASR